MARLWLSLFLLLPALAADPSKTLIVGRGAVGDPVPAFDHGFMTFTRPTSAAVEVWGPDGLEHFFGSVENPNGAYVSGIAVDADGSAAASIGFLGPETFNGGIAYFDPSGKQTRFVDTGSYRPAHLCFDKNHSLWTFGWMRDVNGYEERGDYMMFRRYSGDGTEAGTYGPRSVAAARGLDSGHTVLGGWHLKAIGDRVGALASYRADSSEHGWIELGIDDGHIIGIWPLGRDLQGGMAFTDDAKLCRQAPGKSISGIDCLDRTTGKWKHAGDAPVRGLLGADGDELVFMRGEGVIHLFWAQALKNPS
jgi:hypothetical protein